MIKNLFVLPLAGFVFTGCATGQGKNFNWEYTTIDYANTESAGAISNALNNSAANGWIFVTAVPIKNGDGPVGETRYILKRPKQ